MDRGITSMAFPSGPYREIIRSIGWSMTRMNREDKTHCVSDQSFFDKEFNLFLPPRGVWDSLHTPHGPSDSSKSHVGLPWHHQRWHRGTAACCAASSQSNPPLARIPARCSSSRLFHLAHHHHHQDKSDQSAPFHVVSMFLFFLFKPV